MLIVQSDEFNRSRIATTLAVVLTTNMALAEAPGNVPLPRKQTGLSKDSVANVSQLVTVDRRQLTERMGVVPGRLLVRVDNGLRLVLHL